MRFCLLKKHKFAKTVGGLIWGKYGSREVSCVNCGLTYAVFVPRHKWFMKRIKLGYDMEWIK